MRERAEGKISSIEPRLLAKPRLSLDLFGAPRFRLGRPLRLEAPPRTLPLLAYVVLHGPDPVSRSTVAAAVWPESSDADARTNLRRHVHALRKALAHHDVASDVLLSEGATVRLNPAIDIDIDVRDYARLASSDVTLADAVALYRGDLLETLDDEWAYAERLRLRGAQLGNLERLADLARCDGDRETASRWLSAALAFEPWNEELATQAMTLAWECGRRHDALLVYRQFAERFRAELGAGPLPRTTSLYAAIAEGRAFRSLGFVPEDTTSFVGRSAEFRALVERMRHDRLVTLTGAPGIGKTRLALRAARFLARSFADGAFVVDVASATDAATVRASLAAALDLFGPAGPRDVSLERRMRDLRALVVLDNCEHVGEACAAVVGPLLAASPGTRVLATSHDRLNVSAERVIALGPMSAASEGPALFVERARAIDADFVVDPSQLAKVGDICALLDGLPLAIELAAVRAPAHGIAGLEALLRDRFDVLDRGYRDAPAHHRTLHSAFARSVDALAAEDRTAFLAASVFAGGFESEQLSVLLESVAPGDVGAACDRLADRSLVALESVAPRRYRLLHSARDYAWRSLVATDLDRYRQLHVRLFGMRAETACRNAVPSAGWFADVGRDIGDYRAALDYALVERNDPATGAALAAVLGSFWQFGAYRLEGLRYIERALAEASVLDDATVGRLWLARAGFFVADEERIRSSEYARDAFRRAGDRHGAALALQRIATHEVFTGRFERAATNLDEAIAIFAEFGDDFRVDRCEKTRADLERLRGNTALARDRYEACLVRARARDDAAGVEAIVMGLAETEQRLGNTERALALTFEALGPARERGDAVNVAGFGLNVAAYLLRLGRDADGLVAAFDALGVAEDAELAGLFVPIALQHIAAAVVTRGEYAIAARLVGFADEAYRASSAVREDTERVERDALQTALFEHLDAGERNEALAAGAALTRGSAIALAQTVRPRPGVLLRQLAETAGNLSGSCGPT